MKLLRHSICAAITSVLALTVVHSQQAHAAEEQFRRLSPATQDPNGNTEIQLDFQHSVAVLVSAKPIGDVWSPVPRAGRR